MAESNGHPQISDAELDRVGRLITAASLKVIIAGLLDMVQLGPATWAQIHGMLSAPQQEAFRRSVRRWLRDTK